ncbi:hypothetical protein GFB56_25470 [Ensifer sp. T173]|uniref:Uncharacterized protein n=1 Tax=Ensifer canadensis TaxID=555315 RepID=A0AAW4FS08_9HYPH|nr:hypothetical protein [Ensifer canadensis]
MSRSSTRHRAAHVSGSTCRRHDALLHVSLNRIRFKDKNMQQFKVLQRPLRV